MALGRQWWPWPGDCQLWQSTAYNSSPRPATLLPGGTEKWCTALGIVMEKCPFTRGHSLLELYYVWILEITKLMFRYLRHGSNATSIFSGDNNLYLLLKYDVLVP